ncbi:hypothetical protein NPIL_60501 [Nephila pilipes]|uniref:Uncharacterized protein n=1 Tax=Nephila pilipes TaxID=299642 RepID=A0A8X6MN77_NEPPI|nr:hypothetical protein NPIL_60501 [Nephila pilipes]
MKEIVRRLYDTRDEGRAMLVACKGEQQTKFFKYLGLPSIDMNSRLVKNCPKYDEMPLYDFPQVNCHMNLQVHRGNDELRCSRMIAYTYARYLEKLREDKKTVPYLM